MRSIWLTAIAAGLGGVDTHGRPSAAIHNSTTTIRGREEKRSTYKGIAVKKIKKIK